MPDDGVGMSTNDEPTSEPQHDPATEETGSVAGQWPRTTAERVEASVIERGELHDLEGELRATRQDLERQRGEIEELRRTLVRQRAAIELDQRELRSAQESIDQQRTRMHAQRLLSLIHI